ncbi:hypothetical protein TNCV_679431 [Trichonephila clavipes]|nr:hypothetical protein TNCV_679431 [Trichonephila clavipes]
MEGDPPPISAHISKLISSFIAYFQGGRNVYVGYAVEDILIALHQLLSDLNGSWLYCPVDSHTDNILDLMVRTLGDEAS